MASDEPNVPVRCLIAIIIGLIIVIIVCCVLRKSEGFKVNNNIESETVVDTKQKKALIDGRTTLVNNTTKLLKPLGFSMSNVNITALASGEYVIKAKCERKVQKFNVETRIPIDLKDANAANVLAEAIKTTAKQL